jgi:hypothetical protein
MQENQMLMIPISLIDCAVQHCKHFDKQFISQLATSIGEFGVLEPIVVKADIHLYPANCACWQLNRLISRRFLL